MEQCFLVARNSTISTFVWGNNYDVNLKHSKKKAKPYTRNAEVGVGVGGVWRSKKSQNVRMKKYGEPVTKQ